MRGVRVVMAAAATAVVGVGMAGLAAAEGANELATADCVTQWTDEVISGAEPGGTGSGPEAIFAFQYAYYVQRSGAAARDVVASNATNIGSAEMIQHGIDEQPIGSRYCVRIVPAGSSGGSEKWDVQVTQQYPDGQRIVYKQHITTRHTATGTLLTAIDSR